MLAINNCRASFESTRKYSLLWELNNLFSGWVLSCRAYTFANKNIICKFWRIFSRGFKKPWNLPLFLRNSQRDLLHGSNPFQVIFFILYSIFFDSLSLSIIIFANKKLIQESRSFMKKAYKFYGIGSLILNTEQVRCDFDLDILSET